MQLGIFAKTFDGTDPETVLAAVRAAGFDCAQYNMACSGLPAMPDAVAPEQAARVANAAATTGVGLAAVSGTYNMIHPDMVTRLSGHRKLEALAASCAGLPTGLITLCTGTRDPVDQWKEHPDNDTPEAWRDLLEAMEIAIGIADCHNVDLGIEPELANVVNSAQKARRLIDELGSRRLKIVFDPANLFEVASLEDQRRIVSEGVDLLADRIVMGHAKDRTAEGGFITAGKGILDYPHYLSCLKAVGFNRSLVTHGLKAEEAPDVATFLKAALTDAGLETR